MEKSRNIMVFSVLMGLGLAIMVAYLVMTNVSGGSGSGGGGNRGVMIVLTVVGLGVVALVSVVLLRIMNRGGAVKIKPETAAMRLGLHYTKTIKDKEFKTRFIFLPQIPKYGKITHVLAGVYEGRTIIAFQHTYMIHTGQASIPISHTVYATEVSPDWPTVHIRPRKSIGRLLYKLGIHRGLELDLPQFNRAYRVKCDSTAEDFAITLLTPELQECLLDKSTVAWHIGFGQVCLVYTGAMRGAGVEPSLVRFSEFLSMIPQELEKWEGVV